MIFKVSWEPCNTWWWIMRLNDLKVYCTSKIPILKFQSAFRSPLVRHCQDFSKDGEPLPWYGWLTRCLNSDGPRGQRRWMGQGREQHREHSGTATMLLLSVAPMRDTGPVASGFLILKRPGNLDFTYIAKELLLNVGNEVNFYKFCADHVTYICKPMMSTDRQFAARRGVSRLVVHRANRLSRVFSVLDVLLQHWPHSFLVL